MKEAMPETFQRLFREHYPVVTRKLNELVGDRVIAEDLAQEVFVRLYRSPPDDLACVGPWLQRVLTRHAVWILVYSAALFWSLVGIVHGFGHYPLDLRVLLRSFVLFEWLPLLLLSISMLGSVYLPTLGNGIASALLFAFALFSGILEGMMKNGSTYPGVEKFNLLASLLVPTDGVFRRMAYELIDGSHLP